jgi:antirestriction protein ArdC
MAKAHEAIVNKLVATIERGDLPPWVRPWDSPQGAEGLPVNATTGRAYRGGNVISLWITAQVEGYSGSRWATFKQWQSLSTESEPIGVRKGEKGTVGVYYSSFEDKRKAPEPGMKAKRIPFARAFYLFNADQVEGLPVVEKGDVKDLTSRIESLDSMVAGSDATVIHGGHRACYSPEMDVVKMPERETFQGSDKGDPTAAYYGTLAHELTHWTGHEKRCDRTFGKRFRDKAYAVEELVAELGAAFTLAEHGLGCEELRHAQYLSHWLEVIKEDPSALFTAASKAADAVDFLHRRAKPTYKPQEAKAA